MHIQPYMLEQGFQERDPGGQHGQKYGHKSDQMLLGWLNVIIFNVYDYKITTIALLPPSEPCASRLPWIRTPADFFFSPSPTPSYIQELCPADPNMQNPCTSFSFFFQFSISPFANNPKLDDNLVQNCKMFSMLSSTPGSVFMTSSHSYAQTRPIVREVEVLDNNGCRRRIIPGSSLL